MRRTAVFMATVLAALSLAGHATAADVDHWTWEWSNTSFYPCGNDGAGELVDWTYTSKVVNVQQSTDHLNVSAVVVREDGSGIGQTTGEHYRYLFVGHPDPYKVDMNTDQAFFLASSRKLVWDEDSLLTNRRWQVLEVSNANGIYTAEHTWHGSDCR